MDVTHSHTHTHTLIYTLHIMLLDACLLKQRVYAFTGAHPHSFTSTDACTDYAEHRSEAALVKYAFLFRLALVMPEINELLLL